MSKAEDKAYEAYPIVMSQHSDNCKEYDSNESDRLTFIEGYQQAEKDLELTWKDIESIHILMAHQEVTPILWKCGNEAFYQEVLKRFKERKEK